MIKNKNRIDNIDKIVSNKLKRRRILLGLSQQEVGREIDVSIQQIQKYENAKNRIASGKLFNIAKFLKVPLNYFFENNDNTNFSNDKSCIDSKLNNLAIETNAFEKEIMQLIKSFHAIKNSQTRKKVIELIKTF